MREPSKVSQYESMVWICTSVIGVHKWSRLGQMQRRPLSDADISSWSIIRSAKFASLNRRILRHGSLILPL